MKLSMGSWSFAFGPYAAEPKALDECIRRLAAAGFDGIELSGFPPHASLDRYPTKESRAGLRRMLADEGLGVSGYSADLSEVNPTAYGNRARYIDGFKSLVELCVDVGAPSIRIDTGSAPGSIPDTDYHPTFYRLADLWRDCADEARAGGIPIVWEFEPGFVFNKPSEVFELHERVGHPFFQIMFDTAHAYMCSVVGARQHGKRETLEGGVVEFLEMLHGSIGALHVIDSDGTLVADDTSTHVPLGDGNIPFRVLAPKLRAVPHVEWWCADLCFHEGAWEQVEDNLRRAKSILAMSES